MFKSVIYLNGSLPEFSRFSKLRNYYSIAADYGAASKVLQQSHKPDLVIGDGDSPQLHEECRKLNYLCIPDQNSTDFDKCLSYIEKKALFPTLVCGIAGGEIDHQLNNLHSFARSAFSHPMLFLDAPSDAIVKVGMLVRSKISIEAKIGTRFSVIPFPKAYVKSTGLKWPLNNDLLELTQRTSARNQSSAKTATIEVKDGSSAFVICDLITIHSLVVDDWALSSLQEAFY